LHRLINIKDCRIFEIISLLQVGFYSAGRSERSPAKASGISVNKIFAQPKDCIYLQPNSCKMRRDIFQAIADPTRRAILGLLALQAMTPNALAEHFDSSRQAVSKHIKILAECKLVKQEQSGREIFYHFNAKKMKEVDKWMEQFRACWEDRFDQLDNVLKNQKNK
jgi:DNA-binding transcriptional ArsR family regulator